MTLHRSTVASEDALHRPPGPASRGEPAAAGAGARGGAASTGKPLATILVVGALVRIVLVATLGDAPPTIEDARDYNRLATALVETGSYVDASGRPTSLRPPLYPLVVSGIYGAVGVENFQAVSAVQAALSLVTVALVYRLGAALYSPQIGLWAAGATCFYPTLLAYNQFLLSEVLFTFFVTAGALASVRVLQAGQLQYAVLLGLCLGLGALTRSVLWLLAPPLCLGVMCFARAPLGRRLLAGGAALVVFAAVIAPWAWRNTALQRTVTLVDVMGGRNVMMGNYQYTPLDRSWATIETEQGDRAWHRVLAAETPGYGELTQGQIDKAAMRYGVKYFLTHPTQSLARSTVKGFNFWQLEREIVAGLRQGLFGDVPLAVTLLAAAVTCGSYVVTIFAAIFGIAVVPPPSRREHLVLLFWIAAPWAVHAVAFAHSRYHLPLIPILTVYAAAAFCMYATVAQRRRTWRFAAACLACVALTLSWVREFIVLDMKWFT